MGAVFLGVVKGETLLRVFSGKDELSEQEMRHAERPASLQKKTGILLTSSHAQELPDQFTRLPHLAAQGADLP